MKRIVTIQDISCLGKCSLTVALPIISAMGTEAAILPIAVLSTHTMFKNFTIKDLSDQIGPIADHWEKEGFTFDGIYTGYLASPLQIQMMISFFERFGKDCPKIVDPAMGDNGRLYVGFDKAFTKEMLKLCAVADVILPNLTEACFMLDINCPEQYDRTFVYDLLKRLTAHGAKKSIVTGVGFDGAHLGFVGYDRENGEFFEYFHEKFRSKFHGTGDVFSSALVGALMRGKGLYQAACIAADFTCDAIRHTVADKDAHLYGVNFEEALPSLIERINKTEN